MKTLYTLLLWTLIAPAILASDLHPMDRFIDDGTFLVARVTPDQSALKLLDFFAEKIVPDDEPEMKQAIAKGKIELAMGIDILQKSGLQEAYVMLTLSADLIRINFPTSCSMSNQTHKKKF